MRFPVFSLSLACPIIDDPIQVSEPNPEQIVMLAGMGFTSAEAQEALRETVRDFIYIYIFIYWRGGFSYW